MSITHSKNDPCMNCQSDNTEPLYTEDARYKGSWCRRCGAINRPNGIYELGGEI